MLSDHQYHPLPVLDVIDETADTRSFVLDVPTELEETFAYVAGQFCTFRATINGESVVRCYSMSSSPEMNDRFTTTVKRVPGGRMSNWMNDTLARGNTIEVMRPTGLFVLRETDVPLVAFAGGSGITPVMSIIKSALVTTTRPILLVYANRTAGSVIFKNDLDGLSAAFPDRLSIHRHLDSERGLLDTTQCADLARDYTDADFYICGPNQYMETVEEGISMVGVGTGQLFIERFLLSADSDVASENPAPDSLVIKLGRRKHKIRYYVGDTILETARRAGLGPSSSCEAGNCATCMAHLDRGSVTMRTNNALSAAEVNDGWILTCQSIPTSDELMVDYDA